MLPFYICTLSLLACSSYIPYVFASGFSNPVPLNAVQRFLPFDVKSGPLSNAIQSPWLYIPQFRNQNITNDNELQQYLLGNNGPHAISQLNGLQALILGYHLSLPQERKSRVDSTSISRGSTKTEADFAAIKSSLNFAIIGSSLTSLERTHVVSSLNSLVSVYEQARRSRGGRLTHLSATTALRTNIAGAINGLNTALSRITSSMNNTRPTSSLHKLYAYQQKTLQGFHDDLVPLSSALDNQQPSSSDISTIADFINKYPRLFDAGKGTIPSDISYINRDTPSINLSPNLIHANLNYTPSPQRSSMSSASDARSVPISDKSTNASSSSPLPLSGTGQW